MSWSCLDAHLGPKPNSLDISKESQNDLIGTVSRQPELEPAAAPIGCYLKPPLPTPSRSASGARSLSSRSASAHPSRSGAADTARTSPAPAPSRAAPRPPTARTAAGHAPPAPPPPRLPGPPAQPWRSRTAAEPSCRCPQGRHHRHPRRSNKTGRATTPPPASSRPPPATERDPAGDSTPLIVHQPRPQLGLKLLPPACSRAAPGPFGMMLLILPNGPVVTLAPQVGACDGLGALWPREDTDSTRAPP